MPPAFVLRRGERDVQERSPLRALRFANQRHLRFVRQSIALSGVTRNARANDIFPRRHAAAITRNNVIEIQIIPIERDAAVLAGVLVALENIVAGKLYFLLWKPIEYQQYNHTWDTDFERDGCNHLVIGRIR